MAQLRDQWVDYARGLGILLVVYGHVSRGVFNAGIAMNAQCFTLIDSVIYSFHMPLFFFLSGLYFLPSLDKRGPRALLADKLDSLAYPYILWSLLQGGIEVLLARFTTAKTSLADVLSLFWQPRAQFWFLYVLFLIFVLLAWLYRPIASGTTADSKWSTVVRAWIWPLAALLLWLWQNTVQLIFPLDFIAAYLLYFLLGAQFPKWKAAMQARAVACLAASTFSFIALGYFFHAELGLLYSASSWLKLPLALSGITLICSLSMLCARIQNKTLAWLAVCGVYSMPIYLMHILASSGVRIVLQKFLHLPSAGLHIACGMLAGVALPILVYRLSRNAAIPASSALAWLFAPPRWLAFGKRNSGS